MSLLFGGSGRRLPGFVYNAVVDARGGLEERIISGLYVALGGRQRTATALGSKLDGALQNARVKLQGGLKCGRELISTGGYRLLAWATLWRGNGVDEGVFGRCSRRLVV